MVTLQKMLLLHTSNKGVKKHLVLERGKRTPIVPKGYVETVTKLQTMFDEFKLSILFSIQNLPS